MPNPLERETVLRWQVAHYPTDADNVAPDVFDNILYTYDGALARVDVLMTNASNTGVCTMVPVQAIYTFPPNPFVNGFLP